MISRSRYVVALPMFMLVLMFTGCPCVPPPPNNAPRFAGEASP